MLRKENINHDSSQPLYLQVAEMVIGMIEKGELHKNDQLPSVNELYPMLGVSRVTAVNAYAYLRQKGIIQPKHGKGYYIVKEHGLRTKSVFLLFDAMNNYKEVLYRTFISELGKLYTTDVYFHYYNIKQFGRFINNNLGDYNYYVVIPHMDFDVSELLLKLPQEHLLLLDGDVPELSQCAAIYQHFDSDVYQALSSGSHLLGKYSKLNLFASSDFQYIPNGIKTGLARYCTDHDLGYEELFDKRAHKIRKGEVYLAFSENDLVSIIQISKTEGLEPGTDFGLVSYDDTPLKAVLSGGITTITTDFVHMGKMAAKMITENIRAKIANPCRLIIRNSL